MRRRVSFLCMNETRKEDGVTKKKDLDIEISLGRHAIAQRRQSNTHRRVISNEIPVSLFRIELDSKASRVASCVS